ncbi:MAG: DUF1116 domain-containing protein, partial [bacterium]|nr:DUF1116 domain-containing protein [bacterium]
MDFNKVNEEALKKILSAEPTVVGLGIAREEIPEFKENLLLHAGPPVSWEKMCGPMKGAMIGALLYEGKAKDAEEARKILESGKIKFEPCHHHNSVGPMAGVISPRMPVWIVENKKFGNRAYCTLNEGLGKVLRYGAYSEEVITRLKWMEE